MSNAVGGVGGGATVQASEHGGVQACDESSSDELVIDDGFEKAEVFGGVVAVDRLNRHGAKSGAGVGDF